MDKSEQATSRSSEERIEYLERELDAAAQAFAVLRNGLAVLSRHVLRHSAALQVIGPIVEDLAGTSSAAPDANNNDSQRASEEIAELKKMFEKSD